MYKLSPQLTLGLGLKDEATFANFYPGSNQQIIDALQKTAAAKGERIIFICASRGQGSSHLLQACCHQAHQAGLTSGYLPLGTLSAYAPEILDGFDRLQLVCLDDLHAICGKPDWEEALFHFFNRIYDAGSSIVMAANDLPRSLQLGLPDLISRLSWGVVYQLHPLLDTEKLAALTMRAKQRGFNLPEEVGRFIMVHCPRHMGTLFAALDALDKASLAAQRRLTIPFVKNVLLI